MCKRRIKYLLTALLFSCLLGAGNPDELNLAKERLQSRIDQDKKECAKGRALSVLLGSWGPFLSELCKARKSLAILVKRTSPEEVPDVLVNIFIDEYAGGATRGQYPPMKDYLRVFGEPAVTPLMNRFREVREFNRQYALRTLGEIGSEKALPLVRSELKTQNLFTLSSAAYAIRMIRKEGAKEDLLPLLSDLELDPKAVPLIVRQLSSLEEPGWYDIVLDLAQEGKIHFQTIADLGSFQKYPELVVATHLDYLLAQWSSGNSDTVACLLFQIHERSYLKQFFPILEDLLRAKYRYTGNRYSPLTVKCQYFNRSRRHPLLDRIENTLTLADIEEWIHKRSPGWVSYLYLHEFYQRKGGPPFDASKMVFRLKVSVYDDANNILLGEVSEEFPNGVTKNIKLQLDNSNDEPYRIFLTPQLQKDITQNDRWIIDIPVFMIDLPVGCGFPLKIPMQSYAFNKTRDSAGKITRWEVRHIGPPPTK